ncbi:ABC transporter permease [Sulfoacidibacillus thermotolerans]|uniref:Transport permease protein n=1 Tax=Sulfoacidibacillus thermotolerans TaxID=1765684 RepID=A0A2U3DBB7_SULT2|nr:ABC transporter permease [Sulfoacidibacillus thermotolerans]PWI58570.1 hypothetical protein BM613_03390 [Sulfoacidibacillus thermotolerans]
MNGLWRLLVIETKLFFREKQAVFWTFLFPLAMIWLFGEMFGKSSVDGMSYSDAYVPSWLAINMLTIALFTIGTTLSSYRQTGVLRRLQATPVPSWMILAAHMAYGIVIFSFSALVVILFGKLQFQLNWPKYWGSTFLALFLSVAALFPFGLLLTSFAKNPRTAAAISSLLLYLMLFLSGATFPVSEMPKFLQQISKILPLYYVIDLLRKTWNFYPISKEGTDVWVLVVIFIGSILLAPRFFRWNGESS